MLRKGIVGATRRHDRGACVHLAGMAQIQHAAAWRRRARPAGQSCRRLCAAGDFHSHRLHRRGQREAPRLARRPCGRSRCAGSAKPCSRRRASRKAIMSFCRNAAVLKQGLPADVYRRMAADFDAQYPRGAALQAGTATAAGTARLCRTASSPFPPTASGTTRQASRARHRARLLRSGVAAPRLHQRKSIQLGQCPAVTRIASTATAVSSWAGDRWHLAMPWFEMLRLPAAFAGGELCWRGEVMWEGEGGAFAALRPRAGCRAIRARGRRPPRLRHRRQAGHAGDAA